MKIEIGVSNHHVHLTKEDLKTLFGENIELENIKSINQPGQFASQLKVDIKTKKATITGVRILGPCRDYTQVEVSKTDCFILGIDAPIRGSGDLDDASEVTIVSEYSSITKSCAIIADRHIHINHELREKMNLLDINEVSVRVGEEKSSIIEHVQIKESESSYFELHLDTDDGNACLLKSGDHGEIILN